MNLFQHNTLGGSISITTTARFPADGAKVSPDFSVVATFGNDEGGKLAYRVFRLGMSSGPFASSTLFNETTGQYEVGSLDELLAPAARPSCRNFIYGIDTETSQIVFARKEGDVISWSPVAPTPEQDPVDGSMGDETRAVYFEIKDNAPATVRDISSINYQGPNVLTVTAEMLKAA